MSPTPFGEIPRQSPCRSGHTAQVLCSFSELLSRTDRRTGAPWIRQIDREAWDNVVKPRNTMIAMADKMRCVVGIINLSVEGI